MKEIIYNITQQTAGRVVVVSGLDEELTKDNVLGIINKTQSQVLYTPVQAANMSSSSYQDGTMTISLAGNVPSINAGDELLVKLYSDKEIDLSAFAKESTLLAESQTIQSAIQNIDLSSVESKVEEVGNKIDNIKLPEIDTTELAKQGENKEATNSKMYETLNELPNRILDIIESKTTFPLSYDGAVCPYPISSIISAIDNRYNITELTDDKTFELTKVWTKYGLPNVTILTLNILRKVVRRGFGGSSIKELYLPAFKYSDAGSLQVFADANNLMKLSIPNATGFTGNYEFSSPYLIDLEIGKAFNSSQNFGAGQYGWNPVNAMSGDSNMVEDKVDEFGRAIVTNKDQLLYNIRRHFAANLRELTNGEGYYIALGPIKDIIIDDEPTYSAFTNKGWTLA